VRSENSNPALRSESMTTFEKAFKAAQSALGLSHYRINFEATDMGLNYAEIQAEPARCFAHVRYDPAALERDGETLAIATHEVCHLLLADLVHSFGMSAAVSEMEEERTVGRLEKIVMRGIFLTQTAAE
jgi:hypothetical protein